MASLTKPEKALIQRVLLEAYPALSLDEKRVLTAAAKRILNPEMSRAEVNEYIVERYGIT